MSGPMFAGLTPLGLITPPVLGLSFLYTLIRLFDTVVIGFCGISSSAVK
jgi:ABC-type enterochelin transport system permease subunit